MRARLHNFDTQCTYVKLVSPDRPDGVPVKGTWVISNHLPVQQPRFRGVNPSDKHLPVETPALVCASG
jgi:hypothetical protein